MKILGKVLFLLSLALMLLFLAEGLMNLFHHTYLFPIGNSQVNPIAGFYLILASVIIVLGIIRGYLFERKHTRFLKQAKTQVRIKGQQLYTSEEQYHRMVESVEDYAILMIDLDGKILNWNVGAQRIKGYSAEEIIGKNFRVFYTKADQESQLPERLLNEALEKGKSSSEGFRVKKNGSVFWGSIVLNTLRDQQGKPVGFSKVTRDITEKKNAEERKLETEKHFRRTIDTVGDSTWERNYAEGNIHFSENIVTLTGYSAEELSGNEKAWLDKVVDEDRHLLTNTANEYLQDLTDHHMLEYRVRHRNDSIVWILERGAYQKGENGHGRKVIGTHSDVTEKKRIEEKIINSQKRFEAIFHSQYQLICLLNANGKVLEVNHTALRAGQLQAEDVIGKFYWDCYWWKVSPAHQEQLREAVRKASKGELVKYETTIWGTDQSEFFIDFSLKPVFDANGKINLLLSEGRDITQIKKTEKLLKEAQRQLTAFMETLPALAWIADEQGLYKYTNPRYNEFFRSDHAETGKNINEVFPSPSTIMDSSDPIAEHPDIMNGNIHTAIAADGSRHILQIYRFPLGITGDQSLIGGIALDITKMADAEKTQLLLNEKLTVSNSELEQFAYVVSHDLQEPLRMVTSFLQLLQKKFPDLIDKTAAGYIHYAVDGAERMKLLIADLLKFSRLSNLPRSVGPVDMFQVVNAVVHTCEELIRESGAVIKMEPLPVIRANRMQMEQLIQNLVSNSLKYRGADPPLLKMGASQKGGTWEFYFSDNGIGIHPKYFNKIFTIFQRLHGKSQYSGTGIGLAICKKIVEGHGGRIWLESEPGKGTTFYFTINQ